MIGFENRILQSKRLTYRLLNESDKEALHEILSDKSVTEPAGFMPADSKEQFERFFAEQTQYHTGVAILLGETLIGYIHVNDAMEDADRVYTAICGAGRALGYICAPVLMQKVIERCIDSPTDIEQYERNRELLCDVLDRIGYEYVEPEGAFYLWMRALEPDAEAFSNHAKDYELLLVPSDSFGAEGWVRLSYCIDENVIIRSEDALKALYESYL